MTLSGIYDSEWMTMDLRRMGDNGSRENK